MIGYNALHYFIWGLIVSGLTWASWSYFSEWQMKRHSVSFMDRYRAQMSLYMMTTPEKHAEIIRRKRLMTLFFLSLLIILGLYTLV